MKKIELRSIIRPISITSLFLVVVGCIISQPTFRSNSLSELSVDEKRLKVHVNRLTREFHPRDWSHKDNLDGCAEYIGNHFKKSGAVTEFQFFKVHGREFSNVIARFGEGKGSKIIIGAHYDSCGDTPGADDNASGVAGLIELAYLFSNHPPQREVELVAYSLEEPPFFGSDLMGSAFHARSIAESKADISGVIVLEMIGCFSDSWWSQSYPFPLLRLFYPNRGNFIAVIGRWDQGAWIKDIKAGMKGTTSLAVYSMRAPNKLRGVDFSDHRNYWPYGINAIMVTDTAFYRNKNYHTIEDTADSLDYTRMGQVVVAVFESAR